MASIGDSSGSSTADAVGESTAVADGSSAGTSTVGGIGAATAAAVGASAGTSTAAAVGSGAPAAVGSAAGTSTATAVGASVSASVGAAAGIGSASATSAGVVVAVPQAHRLPDVDGGFRWTLQFRTDVMTAWDGTEQRVATNARSRDRYEGSFFLDQPNDRYVRSLLSRIPGSVMELPMPHEAVAATNTITATTITITETYVEWAVAGRRIYVVGPAGDAYAASITVVAGDTLTVNASPPAGSFPAGSTFVYPIEPIWLEDGQTVGRYPVQAARWNFTGRAQEFRTLVGTGATLTTFDSLPVLDRRPRSAGLAQEQILAGLEFVDGGGHFVADTDWTRSKHRRMHEWLIRSPAERQWWKLFLATTRGRWKPFLCPTWRPDLIPYDTTPSALATFIEIDPSTNYVDEWYPSLAHRRIQVEFTDGTVQYFEVTSASDEGDYHQLNLDGEFAGGQTIEKVSFLEYVRLDTDEPSIEYGEGWRGRISLPIIAIQEAAAAPPIEV